MNQSELLALAEAVTLEPVTEVRSVSSLPEHTVVTVVLASGELRTFVAQLFTTCFGKTTAHEQRAQHYADRVSDRVPPGSERPPFEVHTIPLGRWRRGVFIVLQVSATDDPAHAARQHELCAASLAQP